MPTYYASDTKVSLLVSSLDKTTHQTVEYRQSAKQNENVAHSQTELEGGQKLQEVAIKGDAGRVRFLGEYDEVPFLLVRAGLDLFQAPIVTAHGVTKAAPDARSLQASPASNASQEEQKESGEAGTTVQKGSQSLVQKDGPVDQAPKPFSTVTPKAEGKKRMGSATTAPPTDPRTPLPHLLRQISTNSARASVIPEPQALPQALSVLVNLGVKSFLRSDDPQDIKIEIFLNGIFAGSSFIPAKRSPRRDPRAVTVILSGTRCHRVIEKPWILVPPGQNTDGSLRGRKRGKPTAEDHWGQISEALLNESDSRRHDQSGSRPPTAEYLEHLAKFTAPNDVKNLQKPGGLKLGVVDVIISLGSGERMGPIGARVTSPDKMVDSKSVIEEWRNTGTVLLRTPEPVTRMDKPRSSGPPTSLPQYDGEQNAEIQRYSAPPDPDELLSPHYAIPGPQGASGEIAPPTVNPFHGMPHLPDTTYGGMISQSSYDFQGMHSHFQTPTNAFSQINQQMSAASNMSNSESGIADHYPNSHGGSRSHVLLEGILEMQQNRFARQFEGFAPSRFANDGGYNIDPLIPGQMQQFHAQQPMPSPSMLGPAYSPPMVAPSTAGQANQYGVTQYDNVAMGIPPNPYSQSYGQDNPMQSGRPESSAHMLPMLAVGSMTPLKRSQSATGLNSSPTNSTFPRRPSKSKKIQKGSLAAAATSSPAQAQSSEPDIPLANRRLGMVPPSISAPASMPTPNVSSPAKDKNDRMAQPPRPIDRIVVQIGDQVAFERNLSKPVTSLSSSSPVQAKTRPPGSGDEAFQSLSQGLAGPKPNLGREVTVASSSATAALSTSPLTTDHNSFSSSAYNPEAPEPDPTPKKPRRRNTTRSSGTFNVEDIAKAFPSRERGVPPAPNRRSTGYAKVPRRLEEVLEEEFEIPGTSQDSVVSYAKPGPWMSIASTGRAGAEGDAATKPGVKTRSTGTSAGVEGNAATGSGAKRRRAESVMTDTTDDVKSVSGAVSAKDMPGVAKDVSGVRGVSVLRQVRGERPSEFKEDSVLLGVRFVVA
ncbi:hypothetical protein NA57DRAFT_54948 [Rhizodiscina lignyota]|uniref:Uncharacterized protein n=1 Tax=Rhizodiscina lignyota TaxID=1504668 RepID=A0A9P4IKF3_9PEZI|nr:hypothetical protein NA57DRAFT_54948 [Rhizodiscina lignyota]